MSDSSNDKVTNGLKQEIDQIRDDIGGLVTELDHRRHDLFDVERQVRRHGGLLAIVGVGLIGVTAGAVLLTRRRHRARRSLPSLAVRAGKALVRLVNDPERQSPPPPSIGRKIVTAAGAAAASVLVRRLLQHLIADRPSSYTAVQKGRELRL